MTNWAFVAALSWLVVATIGLVVAVISALTIVSLEFAAEVAVLAVALPFAFAYGILVQRSATASLFGSAFGFGSALYVSLEFGPTKATLILIWLGVASTMAYRSLRAQVEPVATSGQARS